MTYTGVAKIPDPCASKPLADGATCMMPDAQMTGLASDFHKFHFALANNGRAHNDYQLLSSRSVEVMMANSLPDGKTVGDMAAPFAALFDKPWMVSSGSDELSLSTNLIRGLASLTALMTLK